MLRQQPCTAFPPDPGDKPQPDVFLRAVNGSRIQCYGFKDIEVQIGRKTYHFKAVKANVESPVLGWDFIRRHRLNFIWNEWGDITVNDRKADITTTLSFRSVPFKKSLGHEKLAFLTSPAKSSESSSNWEFSVSAMKNLGEDVAEAGPEIEDIDQIPDGIYKDLLAKFPELLQQTFNKEASEK